MGLWLFALALSLVPTTGPTTREAAAYDGSTPVAAAKSLDRANDRHDVEAVVVAYVATTDEERALLDSMRETELAGRALYDACMKRFGRDLPSKATHAPAPADYVADIHGDDAVVYLGGKQPGLPTHWVRTGGRWRIPMKDILQIHLRAYKSLNADLEQRRRWTEGLNGIAHEVVSGRYGSAEDVDKALDDLANRESQ
ncbi:MAG TPA: hypothetical protein VGI81_05320 [Tepidisphaeraceae bacterium]|jgi:hypothetical protein